MSPVMKSHKDSNVVAQTATNLNDVLGPRTPLAKVPTGFCFMEPCSAVCRAHAPTITDGVTQRPWGRRTHNQEPKTITHKDEKICFGTGSGKWFCNMEYVSMKVQ